MGAKLSAARGTFWFFACLGGIAVANASLAICTHRSVVWIATLALVVVLMGVIGAALTGRPSGILIDRRNRISLSRFQMAAWTALAVSALFTAALSRVLSGGADASTALDIAIPGALLAAIGIAAGSAVAAPSLLSLRSDDAAHDADANRLRSADASLIADSKIVSRADHAGARWADMFMGDEVGNAAAVDLSKVQQFLVTLLLLAVYGAQLCQMFHAGDLIAALPPMSEDFVKLLAISHASYLAYKAVPHSKTVDDPAPAAAPSPTPQPLAAAGAPARAVG